MSPVFKKNKGLQDKLNELVTFRGILINQIDRLQMYFDTCLAEFASSNGNYHIKYIIIKNVSLIDKIVKAWQVNGIFEPS